MSDIQLSAIERRTEQATLRPATPELDEGQWLAWKEKNWAKDRIRGARRRRIALILIAAAAIALAVAYFAGAIA